MNEKQKTTIISFIFICLILCVVIQSVVFTRERNQLIRRYDTQVDTLERQLDTERARLEDCKRTITDSNAAIRECAKSVNAIADSVGRESGELQSIIGNLRTVRKEVENMENALNLFYDKYGDSNLDTDN